MRLWLLGLCLSQAAALHASAVSPALRSRAGPAVKNFARVSSAAAGIANYGSISVPATVTAPLRARVRARRADPPRASMIAGPEWLSLLPPLVTLVASIAFRQARRTSG